MKKKPVMTLGKNGLVMSQKTKSLKTSTEGLLKNLNDAQRQAVTFGTGPLLIVAGAGTGKTTAMTRRIAYLIAGGVKPDALLALTFTEKSASEMEERVDLLLPYGYYDLWISTFHAFCERILKQHALDIGIPNDFTLADTIQQRIIIRKNLELFNLDYYKPIGNPNKFVNELVKHFSKLKDEEIYPEQYLNYAKNLQLDTDSADFLDADEIKRVQEIANAYHVYQKLLLENNTLDFGDLINYSLQLFRKRAKILNYYQNKFKFVLVDEFQDTNFAQYELVKLLSAPKNNLNVVGDDDQSIYKFRGASVSNILQFKKDFPEAKEVTLIDNYRSAQNILDLSYDFIKANNPNRLEVQLDISKKLVSHTKEQGIIEVLAGNTLSDETDLVMNKILELKKKNQELTWNDFAILIRANDQADPFTAKFTDNHIPYTFYANKGLYRKDIIVDLIFYMRLLLNYHDSSLLYRTLNMEYFRITPKDMATLLEYGHRKTLSMYESMEVAAAIPQMSEESITHIQNLLVLIQKHGNALADKTAVELFIIIVRDLQIAARIEADTLENLENRELLEQFYKKVESFEHDNADSSMRNFLEALTFEQDAGEEGKLNFDPNQGPESVKVLTIHASKGLEFKYVFIVNLVNLKFPSIERHDPIEIPKELIKEQVPEGDMHLEEERRLFYVAVTRAKSGLFLTYATDYGGKQTRKPSQFLVETNLVQKPGKASPIMRNEGNETIIIPNQDLFLPKVFSYTHITDFIKCPMRYKYSHLLHLPLAGTPQLSFGITMHVTLEKFMSQYKSEVSMAQLDLFDMPKKTKIPSFTELKKLYERSWVDDWYENKAQKEEFRARGIDMLHKFYDDFEKHPILPKYLEKKFQLPLGDFTFTGKIDRGDVDTNGTLHIIDYKTGESRIEEKKDGTDQLLIYQWAAEEYLQEVVQDMCYWYLFSGETSGPIHGSTVEIEALKEKLLGTIGQIHDAIRNNNFKALDKKIQHQCEFEEME